MIENPNDIELRSEEIQEILGKPPSKFISWSTSVAFFAVLAMVYGSFIIEYPDTVTDDISVTAFDPPRSMFADEFKVIEEILVEDEDEVEADQTLAVYQSDGEFGDVMTLENYLIQYNHIEEPEKLLDLKIPADLVLGQLQDAVFLFKEKQRLLQSDLEIDTEVDEVNTRQIDRQIKQLRSSVNNLKKQKARLEEEIELAEQTLKRNQNLNKQGRMGIEVVRSAKAELLAKERSMSSVNNSLNENRTQISLLKGRKNSPGITSEKEISDSKIKLEESFKTLKRFVTEWKKENILTSPIYGIVLIKDGIGDNQAVREGTELMTIVPTESKETHGKMNIPVEGSGKLAVGQRVVINFYSYPADEFGFFEGTLTRIGKIPDEGKIPLEISFEEGNLLSSTNKTIEVTQEMKGTATIITEQKKYVERLIERIRAAVQTM